MAVYDNIPLRRSPRVILLSGGDILDSLSSNEKLYAHYMARAAWLGSRIIHCQVSPESGPIFDFIMELYRFCKGDWERLRAEVGLSKSDMSNFLDFSAVFLQNVGNYYGRGDQKFIPNLSNVSLEKLSLASASATQLFNQIKTALIASNPTRLGFTDEISQTSYYIGSAMSAQEVETVSQAALKHDVQLENTRVWKEDKTFDILIASVEKDVMLDFPVDQQSKVRIVRGDHSAELEKVCSCLSEAEKYASNAVQRDYVAKLKASFQTGDMEFYKDAQRLWVQDSQPNVETILGFVEPYRDPYGVRAEFEGLVGIVHKRETELLSSLLQNADRFISTLPWVRSTGRGTDKGPFEVQKMGHRDFTSLHPLAYCSTVIFGGINLPNYNDIRQRDGSKNVLIPGSIKGYPMEADAEFLGPDDKKIFLEHYRQADYLYVTFHELFGHGTGRFLEETAKGVLNFDPASPPIDPATEKPVDSWYSLGQTYTQVFGDIAASVDECRAECVSACLFGNRDLLEFCGFTERTELTAAQLEYTLYMEIAIDGLRSLKDYSLDAKKWGQAHSRAHFAMMRTLLETCDGFVSIKVDPTTEDITVHVDRSKIVSQGRPAIGLLALKLHIFRCTADVKRGRSFYEALTALEEPYLSWRRIMVPKKPAPGVFVQPNAVLEGNHIVLKEYPATVEGMIQSWAERGL